MGVILTTYQSWDDPPSSQGWSGGPHQKFFLPKSPCVAQVFQTFSLPKMVEIGPPKCQKHAVFAISGPLPTSYKARVHKTPLISSWWFHVFLIFSLYLEKMSNLTSIFLRWVGSTTNQLYVIGVINNPSSTHIYHFGPALFLG